MNLFDRLVDQALRHSGVAPTLQPVIEKELLHHDILREMSRAGLLKSLTFIGGTCLRACYGSPRLSEDLDFTGGHDFTHTSLATLGGTIEQKLGIKYGLDVVVSDPVLNDSTVATWKVKVTTQPKQKNMPLQRINIDICAIPSYDIRPAILRNYYGVDMGTAGLILNVQSREEILADKFVALAFRNRVKNRDLWDILWLQQQGVKLPVALLPDKVRDHRRKIDEFLTRLLERVQQLKSDEQMNRDFIFEMRRFLPEDIVRSAIENPAFWTIVVDNIKRGCDEIHMALSFGDIIQ